MIKKSILFFAFLCITLSSVFSQSKSEMITDLESDLLLSNNSIEQIKIHRKLADLYLDVSLAKSFNHLFAIDKLLKKTSIDDFLRADFYGTYGDAYYTKADFPKALEYYKKQLDIVSSLGYKNKADSITYNIAATAFQINDFKTAEEYYQRILATARQKNDIELVKELNLKLYKINSQSKDYQEALLYLEAYLDLIDSDFLRKGTQITILKKQVTYTAVKLTETTKNLNVTANKLQETNQNLTETNLTLKKTDTQLKNVTKEKLLLENDVLKQELSIKNLEVEKTKKDQVIKDKEAQNRLQEQKLSERKKVISLLTFIIAGAGFAGIIILFLYGRIRRQKNKLKSQKHLIEEKNKEITESIYYARRIQNSIMLTEHTLRKYLPDMFVYFRPRDIVSGDFYWFTNVENKLLIAAVDCTGHGVPGAFLSMIGNTLLNKIVNEYKITSPSMILSYLHEGMMATLEQNVVDTNTEDGMDMTICTIVPEEKLVLYAGAKNPLLVYIEDQLVPVKADFHTIGEHPLRPGMEVEFTEHQIAYDDETIIYLMTDGYTDQFGGEKDKGSKFNVTRFKDILIQNSHKSMEDIKTIISDSMDEWKKNNEQTDDMLVIGIRLKDINVDD